MSYSPFRSTAMPNVDAHPEMKTLVALLVMVGTLFACGVPPRPEEVPATSGNGEVSGPSTKPTQPAPPPPGTAPTLVPTLAPGMHWIEPGATKGIVLEVPNEISGGQDIYLISPDGDPPMLLTNLKGIALLSAAGAPNGKWLAIESESIGPNHEFFSENLSLLSLDTLELKPIIEKTSVINYAWSPTGDMLAYTELMPEGSGKKIGIYDMGTGGHRVLFQSTPPGGWDVQGWALEGKSLLIAHFLGGGLLFDEAALLDVSTGSVTTIYSDPDKLTQTVIPAPDGRVAIVFKRSSSNLDTSGIFLLELASGALTPWIEPGVPDLFIASLPVWSSDGRRVALTVSGQPQKGISIPLRIIVIDITGRRSEVIRVETPPMLIRPLEWASDDVLIVNNLGGEALDEVVYSVHADGSQAQKVSWGRFLTTIPITP